MPQTRGAGTEGRDRGRWAGRGGAIARVLIVGCGCRGLALARELGARGHVIRATTRNPARRTAIEAAGAEAFVADPNRVGTLTAALEGVGVLCLLLGSASGPPEALAALHGSRLEMLLERVIDTTVRGLVYEATGSIDAGALGAGAERVRVACTYSRVPHALLDGRDREPGRQWPQPAVEAVEGLLCGH